ncbi:MAG: methyltransferase [Actinobacteria bacterium]|nr:methyltransferase [Actinomycetota bacterium]
MDAHREANRRNWDDRVPIHLGSEEYAVERFVADPGHLSSVVEFDREVLGDVAGLRLLHLQCHFGKDTLSWARLGAEVTGVDFSERAVAEARRLAERSGVPGRFVTAEVYDAGEALAGERFDVVYTGVGAINWLPDIAGWARVAAGLLDPGGRLYVREGHPVLWSLDWREDDDELSIRFPYFETRDPVEWVEDHTYAGEGTLANPTQYEWNHGIGEIVTAVLDAGLEVRMLREHRELEWQGLPHMEEGPDGRWRLPPAQRDLVPLMFSLLAVRPAAGG